jgi:hypothetical protein
MPDYKNGQIYRLWSPHTDKFYIGSTCTMLAKRLWTHKTHYKQFLKENNTYMTSYEVLKHGVDDVKIELMELFPCNSKAELNKREGILQRLHKDSITNFNIAGRTHKEWMCENKDKIKNYKINHREQHNKKQQERRDTNRDEVNRKEREHRAANRDEFNRKQRERRAAKKITD